MTIKEYTTIFENYMKNHDIRALALTAKIENEGPEALTEAEWKEYITRVAKLEKMIKQDREKIFQKG